MDWIFSPRAEWNPSSEEEVKAALDGAWELEEIFTVVSGKPETKRPVLGENPRGSIMYDMRRRRMVAFLAKTLPFFSETSFLRANEDSATEAFRSMLAYSGSVEIDLANQCLHHRTDAAWFPNWRDTTQKRYFALSKDRMRLSLRSENVEIAGETLTPFIIWRRPEEA